MSKKNFYTDEYLQEIKEINQNKIIKYIDKTMAQMAGFVDPKKSGEFYANFKVELSCLIMSNIFLSKGNK
ncbi:MAG: hypothetical protein E6R13_03945 [Spirochaetes bacterium]|nr:MAG: hypothetical protein E6R13_03945 [Spirochaetota bacterium]